MKTEKFEIKQSDFDRIIQNKNLGKNGDIGKVAVEIAKMFFLSKDSNTRFETNKKGVDLKVITSEGETNYEIKGSTHSGIKWNALKVSSQQCFDLLTNGTTMMRITNIGTQVVDIYFLHYGVDFILQPEPRWSVKRVK